MDTRFWGEKAWNFLHCFAFENNERNSIFISKFLKNFINIIPCNICRDSALQFYNELNIKDGYFFKITVDFHNLVNKKLKKDFFDFKKAIEKYNQVCKMNHEFDSIIFILSSVMDETINLNDIYYFLKDFICDCSVSCQTFTKINCQKILKSLDYFIIIDNKKIPRLKITEFLIDQIFNDFPKRLTLFLKDYAPGSIKEISINSLYGKKVAIDTSIFIYQALASNITKNVQKKIMIDENIEIFLQENEKNDEKKNEKKENKNDDKKENIKEFLTQFCRIILCILEIGFQPIFVFDGKSPELKQYEIKSRREKRDKINSKLKMEGIENSQLVMTRDHENVVIDFLKALNIPFFRAESEAEATCAWLCKYDWVSAVISEDLDVLPFGSPLLYRSLGRRVRSVKAFSLEQALKELKLSFESFVDLCILMGCDYCDRIFGIGPVTAYEYILKHKSIEKILENEKIDQSLIPKRFNFQEARNFFLKSHAPEFIYAQTWGKPIYPNINNAMKYLESIWNIDVKQFYWKPNIYSSNSFSSTLVNL